MALWNHYFTPQSLTEAADLLAQFDGRACVVAGGTDLILDLQQGQHPPVEALVDITRIEELKTITRYADKLAVGAGVTHAQLVRHPDIAARATCLAESCGVVGGPQVRNVGTLGGNVAHALPAGDGTTSLVALDAQVEFIKDNQRQWAPILDMFTGPGQSLLNSGRDILLQFQFDLCGPRQATAFSRIMRPQGVALPILGCAVWVELDEAGQNFTNARVCVGPVAAVPVRARQTEAALINQPATAQTINAAITVAGQELHPRTSKYRATAHYRRLMIDVLLRRTLSKAIDRAVSDTAQPEFGA